MKTFTRITGFVLLLLAANTVTAQYYEFVENKGQWHERVKFKGNIPNGNFYLEAAGYKIVQHKQEDLENLSEFYGGHKHNQPGGNTGNPGHVGGHGSLPDPIESGAALRSTTTTSSSSSQAVVHSHAYEVTFLGAAKRPSVVPEKPVDSYYNYFIGNDSSKWAPNCKIFQAVTYKNMYPNIDVRYYSDNDNLKYDIIVHPGGDINNIALQFDGADKLELKKGDLIVRTSTGDVTELKPYTYELGQAGKKTVEAAYVVKGNIVKFKLDNYSSTSTIVIDPNLIFSTFTGSSSDNWGFTATYDGLGNLYAGGIVFGSGFPVTNGAYQTGFKGGNDSDNDGPCDIAIMKFNSTGRNRLYATLLGGNGNEQPHSMIVDHNNNLIIAGRTNSGNFPSTTSTYGDGGDFDIFLTKLNATGTALIGSRRIGGTGSDGVNVVPKYVRSGAERLRPNYGDDARSEVIVDDNDNVYLAAQTMSSNFRTTTGAFQRTFGGVQDGVVLKTSPDLSNVIFSSFLGGRTQDAAFVLSLHPQNNNIYVAGATTSDDFPGSKNGPVMQNSFQGGESDGFVSIISNDGTALVKTSYFGTSQEDLIFGIQFDKYGFPYIMGTSKGSWPIVNAAFSQPGGKQFISKLDANLTTWQYSTVFGTNSTEPNISPTAFLVDRCENVYVSGWGGGINQSAGYNNSGTRGLTTTPDAEIPNSLGRDGADFYFFVLKKDAASQLYGSMFGQTGGLGDHVDGGTSRFDKQGIIYQAICANCGGRGNSPTPVIFPTSSGAYSASNGALAGRGCNLAAIKIAFNLAGVGTSIRAAIEGTVKKSGCIPLTVDFRDTIAQAKKYIWSFGDGSADQTTTTPNISHVYNAIGDYNVRLIAIDSGTCNVADTATIIIRARSDRATLAFNSLKLTPPCDQLNYQFDNLSTATRPFNDTSFIWNMGDNTIYTRKGLNTFVHQYAAPGTYNVTLQLADTNYCNYPESLTKQLRIAINVKADFITPPSGCEPYTAEFNNTSLGGQQFFWDFGDGTTSTEVYPSHTYSGTGTFTVKLLAIDPTTCNVRDSTTFTIVVSPNPTAGFTFSPTQPIKNTPFNFVNTSTGAISYLWRFGDGEGFITQKRDTAIAHIYNASGEYIVTQIVTNQYGCSDTLDQVLNAIILPLVDVPNAFTPNGDGINDRVRLRGYGISKMVFRIYNRWGALMYESTSNKDVGWDGRYKGALQPQDVYGYIADIEFTDGKRYQKKGDITLLR